MHRTKVIAYDCDGVLFDSRKSNEAYYNHMLARFGLPPMAPHQLAFVHVSTAQQAVDYLFGDDSRREEAQAYRLRMDYAPFVPIMEMEPNVREVLTRLRPRYGTAIATNRGPSMPLVMKMHRLEGLFDLTVTSLDVREPKPDPECLMKVLDHFGVAGHEAVYIGDAEVDRQVALGAGVPFVAYKNPELKASNHFQDHLDLLAFLEL